MPTNKPRRCSKCLVTLHWQTQERRGLPGDREVALSEVSPWRPTSPKRNPGYWSKSTTTVYVEHADVCRGHPKRKRSVLATQ